MKKHIKKIVIASFCIFLAIIVLTSLILTVKSFLYDPSAKLSQDSDGFFLSMFPVDGFQEEFFVTYEGITISRSDHIFTNGNKLLKAFHSLSSHAFSPKMIYLGLDPGKLTMQQVEELLDTFPNASYKVFLKYRSLLEWKTMDDFEPLFSKYRELTEYLSSCANVRIYPFFAEEWIIADVNNYQDNGGLKEDVSKRVYLYALFSEEERNCQIMPYETDDLFSRFHDWILSVRSGDYHFVDLSDKNVLFIGDSVFGNYTDRRSIPEQLRAMSGANTFNCGLGGALASYSSELPYSTQMLDAVLNATPDVLPEDSQPFIGLTEFLKAESKSALNSPNTVYVLHFGINDYINGAPIETETKDPYDVHSLCGAMRANIEKIRTACPDSRILMVIPNPIFNLEHGTLVMNEEAGVYENYVNALIKVAKESQVPYLDNYHQTINCEKQATYVDDGVHPNDSGRYMISYALMHAIYELYH